MPFGRKKPAALSEDPAENLKRAKTYALRLLGMRARSERELRDKLATKGYGDFVSEVLTWLAKEELIGDFSMAVGLVESSKRYRSYGFQAVKALLMRRGVPPAVVDRAVREHFSETDEAVVAARVLQKLGDLDRKKLAARLQSRGFRGSVVAKALAKYGKNR